MSDTARIALLTRYDVDPKIRTRWFFTYAA